MATFSFRLETVLHARKAERDQCRAVLAQALASLEKIERRITAIKDELRALAQAQPSGHAHIDIERTLWTDRYATALRHDCEDCEQDHRAQNAAVAARREELTAADQEFRKLEKLRDRRQAQFLAAVEQRQQHAMDEIATQAASRKNSL